MLSDMKFLDSLKEYDKGNFHCTKLLGDELFLPFFLKA